RAYDRCLTAGIPIANTLGVHPNDRMFSFYARTPSGFDVEFGHGGRKIDDATWKVEQYDRASVWGHRIPGAQRPGGMRRESVTGGSWVSRRAGRSSTRPPRSWPCEDSPGPASRP